MRKVKPKVYVTELPLVSREYAEALDKMFPEIKPVPGVSRDDLLFNAGMRRVVDKVLNSTKIKEVSGNPEDIDKKIEYKGSLLERFIQGLKR